ncbi:unnamed protein product [Parascedosporium putredinis]|uniref:Histidine acid phosphatase n=1 Tax=Parascedosporium putredinis TaxID=1442378 RepID=A0A9P1H2E8_9PEZI|nr:unnamed protein product [Parascedosporium putredinis]CAI7994906.1 unnamed protein product [Parascedosporium putredinis]
MFVSRQATALLSAVPLPAVVSAKVDIAWYPPARTDINDLDKVLKGKDIYGFIYDSSETPDDQYGSYNWCNMPHVRRKEYVRPSDEYELHYVELIHRHHKRTPYSSNAFPIESYQWNCDDVGLYYHGQGWKRDAHGPARTYWQGYISSTNPFVPEGWIGTCQFPQITAEGLDDSWVHGADLYQVYHDLLGFLPSRSEDWSRTVKYRVTNNVITSQVAGMVVNGMWGTSDPSSAIDSLEPKYSCRAGSQAFDAIKSSANPHWKRHLDAASGLYATLDDISGVLESDNGFHESFDHYYDNLSARQCHSKPLPCKLVNGVNSTTCVTQELANAVYRMGHWEYSQMYRDAPTSLRTSAANYGVWIAELAANMRKAVEGNSPVRYMHNLAHDGSVSRVLSILQIDTMIWPGMGSEVVFEMWKKPSPPDHGWNPESFHLFGEAANTFTPILHRPFLTLL